MKRYIFLFLILFSFFYSFSQSDDNVTRDLKMPDEYKRHVKYRRNDTIYFVLLNRKNDSIIVLKKYHKIRRKEYVYCDGISIMESGKFRKFTFCNNPFKKVIFMEQTGVWKEYDSNNVLIKTIDYDNLDIKSIRLFPIGRYTYINKKK